METHSNIWKGITGQNRVLKVLQNFYKSGRIPHSFIFYGKEGTGKDAVAIAFAKLINCDNPSDFTPCEKCKSCTQISHLASPDFTFITALPGGKKEPADENDPVSLLTEEDKEIYSEEISRKAADNYYKINIPKANFIRIDSIRLIRNNIYLTSSKGKKKIFLISNADMMNPPSVNAFLKTLEEPPPDSLLILTTSKINSLPQTVTGRCQKIRFDDIPQKELFEYAKEKYPNLKDKEALLYSQIADGSILKLKNLIDSDYLELRDHSVQYLRGIVSGKYLSISNSIKIVTQNKNKETVRQFLLLLIVWFKDVINKEEGHNELLINTDLSDTLKNFAKNIKSEYYRIIQSLEEAIKETELNVNAEFLLYRLAFRLKDYLRKKQ